MPCLHNIIIYLSVTFLFSIGFQNQNKYEITLDGVIIHIMVILLINCFFDIFQKLRKNLLNYFLFTANASYCIFMIQFGFKELFSKTINISILQLCVSVPFIASWSLIYTYYFKPQAEKHIISRIHECFICLDMIEDYYYKYSCSCNYYMHESCYLKWIETSGKDYCSICGNN